MLGEGLGCGERTLSPFPGVPRTDPARARVARTKDGRMVGESRIGGAEASTITVGKLSSRASV